MPKAAREKRQRKKSYIIWSIRELRILRSMAAMADEVTIQFIIETIWPIREERPEHVLKLAAQQMIRLRVKMKEEGLFCEKKGYGEKASYKINYKLRDYVAEHLTPYIRPKNKIRTGRLKEILKRQQF